MQLSKLRSWWMVWTARRGYDSYLRWLINELKHVEWARDGERLLLKEKDGGHLEMHSGVRFRYGEYNIISMFDEYSELLINRLKIVNGLGLKSFPVFVESMKVNGGMFVVTYIPGTKEHDLIEVWKAKPSKEAYLTVSHELKTLLAKGYFITRFESYANSYGDIIIPSFYLRKVSEHPDELKDAFGEYLEFNHEEWKKERERIYLCQFPE